MSEPYSPPLKLSLTYADILYQNRSVFLRFVDDTICKMPSDDDWPGYTKRAKDFGYEDPNLFLIVVAYCQEALAERTLGAPSYEFRCRAIYERINLTALALEGRVFGRFIRYFHDNVAQAIEPEWHEVKVQAMREIFGLDWPGQWLPQAINAASIEAAQRGVRMPRRGIHDLPLEAAHALARLDPTA
jgi:hypothetical protein